MNDAIKIMQFILDRVFDHVLFYMEFHDKYKRLSPTVTGINEAIDRIKHTFFEDFHKGVILEMDFEDMYSSNINKTMLKKYFKKGALLARFSETSILYIFSLIEGGQIIGPTLQQTDLSTDRMVFGSIHVL